MGRMVEQEPLLMSTRALGRRASRVTPVIALAIALVFGAWACGDDTSIPNAPPSVGGVDSVECVDGVCDLWLRVVDPDLDGVDLAIECLLDGDQPCELADAPGTDGRYGLMPDREAPGRAHLLRLIPSVDATTTMRWRFTPTDLPGDPGTPLTTPEFTMAEGL